MNTRKKIFAIGYVLVLLLFLAACSSVADIDANAPAPDDTIITVPEQPTTPEPTPEPQPTPEPIQEPTPEPDTTTEPVLGTHFFPFSFSAEDLYGNPVTEESVSAQELFFVYLWTTWCPSCVTGMSDLALIADYYGDRIGFITLLGDFSTARDTAIRITEGAGVDFITVDATLGDFSYLMELLNSGFIPTSILLDRYGNVVGDQIVGSGYERFKNEIQNALGE